VYLRSVTDPSSTKPKLWLTFGWLFAVASVPAIIVGIWNVADGAAAGWVTIVLGLIFIPQSVLYFRLYRQLREKDQSGE